jgi:hypothetical protein
LQTEALQGCLLACYLYPLQMWFFTADQEDKLKGVPARQPSEASGSLFGGLAVQQTIQPEQPQESGFTFMSNTDQPTAFSTLQTNSQAPSEAPSGFSFLSHDPQVESKDTSSSLFSFMGAPNVKTNAQQDTGGHQLASQPASAFSFIAESHIDAAEQPARGPMVTNNSSTAGMFDGMNAPAPTETGSLKLAKTSLNKQVRA